MINVRWQPYCLSCRSPILGIPYRSKDRVPDDSVQCLFCDSRTPTRFAGPAFYVCR